MPGHEYEAAGPGPRSFPLQNSVVLHGSAPTSLSTQPRPPVPAPAISQHIGKEQGAEKGISKETTKGSLAELSTPELPKARAVD